MPLHMCDEFESKGYAKVQICNTALRSMKEKCYGEPSLLNVHAWHPLRWTGS